MNKIIGYKEAMAIIMKELLEEITDDLEEIDDDLEEIDDDLEERA